MSASEQPNKNRRGSRPKHTGRDRGLELQPANQLMRLAVGIINFQPGGEQAGTQTQPPEPQPAAVVRTAIKHTDSDMSTQEAVNEPDRELPQASRDGELIEQFPVVAAFCSDTLGRTATPSQVSPSFPQPQPPERQHILVDPGLSQQSYSLPDMSVVLLNPQEAPVQRIPSFNLPTGETATLSNWETHSPTTIVTVITAEEDGSKDDTMADTTTELDTEESSGSEANGTDHQVLITGSFDCSLQVHPDLRKRVLRELLKCCPYRSKGAAGLVA